MEVMEKRVEEEIVQTWLPLIRRALAHYKVRQDDREDVAQMILCQIFEKRYDQIYDPKKSKLNTFIFAMVSKRIKGMYSKRGRDAIDRAQFIGDNHWIIADRFSFVCGKVERNEFWGLVEEAKAQLSKLPPRRSRVMEDGEVCHRTILAVFELMIKGRRQVDIATEMGYSEGSISIMRQEIKGQPAVQKLLEFHRM